MKRILAIFRTPKPSPPQGIPYSARAYGVERAVPGASYGDFDASAIRVFEPEWSKQ